jgi:hypothetical protein
MLARVTTWEGGTAEAIRANSEAITSQAGSGPPEGVPSVGFTMLTDADNGRVLMIGLFETEEDLRTGDAVLNEMSPPNEGMGTRGPVNVYEVALDIRM